MIGPMLDGMMAAADAEEQARLREKFFPGTEGEITPAQLQAAIPEIATALWFEFRDAELPDVRAILDEHGGDAGMEILRRRFLDFVRARVGGTA
jgi:hypothetical protein